MTSITIVTATLNAANVIGALAADLLAQTDRDFRWLIVDGGSTDGTIERLPSDILDRVDLVRESDFGIYDALNKGVRRCATSHYLVIGADDRLDRTPHRRIPPAGCGIGNIDTPPAFATTAGSHARIAAKAGCGVRTPSSATTRSAP